MAVESGESAPKEKSKRDRILGLIRSKFPWETTEKRDTKILTQLDLVVEKLVGLHIVKIEYDNMGRLVKQISDVRSFNIKLNTFFRDLNLNWDKKTDFRKIMCSPFLDAGILYVLKDGHSFKECYEAMPEMMRRGSNSTYKAALESMEYFLPKFNEYLQDEWSKEIEFRTGIAHSYGIVPISTYER